MIGRPSPGRLRAIGRGVVMHSTGGRRALHHRALPPRPRPCTAPTSRSIAMFHKAALRKAVSSAATFSTHATRLQSTRALRSWFSILGSSLRSLRANTSIAIPRSLLSSWTKSLPQLRSSSPFVRGALDAFRATSARPSTQTGKTASARFTSPFVTFSQGVRSGLGSRPACGPLTLSPLRGGTGLQTARQFSSGGARIFDNLVVNAPLALRLAADQADEKANLSQRKPAMRRRAVAGVSASGPRRTGATFSSANLARNAAKFAATNKAGQRASAKQGHCFTAAEKQKAVETDLSTYFHLPTIDIEHPTTSAVETIITLKIRLSDPLHTRLGGRSPTGAHLTRGGPSLFDAEFVLDAQQALEHEHLRYLQAKAVLRVLWDNDLVRQDTEMDLFSDPTTWTVVLNNVPAKRLLSLLDASLEFDFRPWLRITSCDGFEFGSEVSPSSDSSGPGSRARQVEPLVESQSLSTSSFQDDLTNASTSSFSLNLTPPLSSSASQDQSASHRSFDSSSLNEDLISLPDSFIDSPAASNAHDSWLYDSRNLA
ncbi:hypothetical protein BCV70DRAFT_194051 [Testicularia cyperi]|uniref:Uncharacterized protein n=1 Tax=Testicularia cyperi TaxID=1882483 RepID=A0A317XL32_9BASI|nr:hypothetical protein BCV70DRAFT_194051 [Testicularia cyperi]